MTITSSRSVTDTARSIVLQRRKYKNLMPQKKLTEGERAARRERERLRVKKRRAEQRLQRLLVQKIPTEEELAIHRERSREHRKLCEKNRHLKRKYGITVEKRRDLIKAQHNCCAICATSDPGKLGWHVDHNHATNAVRAVLCQSCNKALAFAKDSPELLRKLASYLEQRGHA